MEIIKKNIVSISCGLVAILALAALYWPTVSWTEALQTKLKASKTADDKITTLLGATRQFPTAPDPSSPNAQPPRLETFPTGPVIEQAKVFTASVTQQSQHMLDQVIERNRHKTIIDFSAKNPADSFNFKHAYLRWIGREGKDDPTTRNVYTVLQGIAPPDDAEIKAEKERIYKHDFEPKLAIVGGLAVNQKEVDDQFNQVVEQLPETLRRQRAEQYKIYLESDAIEPTTAFGPTATGDRQATPEQIWYTQNVLWIDQDVAEAIARVNASAKSIVEAPIKQLIKVLVDEGQAQYITMTPPTTVDANALGGKAFTVSETGRVCNPLYDVIHFHVEMNVDAVKIPMILTELQRGRLLTIYSCDATAIDARAVFTDGYVYGPAPVVKLSMECEDLFMRGWTVGAKEGPLMPPSIQAILGATPASPAAPQ